jgi:hypothetical protein
MKKDVFNEQFAALVKAFVYSEQRATAETQDVYWTMLQDIPDDKFCAGVRRCLAECRFFPTISELGNASLPKTTKTIRERARFATVQLEWYQQVQENREPNTLPDNVRKLIAAHGEKGNGQTKNGTKPAGPN